MPSVVLIVEGDGDVAAMPHLVGKIGASSETYVFAARPIRVGGWGRLKKAGGLEKWVRFAATRDNIFRIIVAMDLDDGCPVEELNVISGRLDALRAELGLEIEVCFCIREYESWLLHAREQLAVDAPEYGWRHLESINNPDHIRDAKGALRSIISQPYAESIDQETLTKKINCFYLYNRSRSFRRFCTATTGLGYEAWNELAADS